MIAAFARRVVSWQRTHGRHDLPWQSRRDAYRIWVSEIMLQQTQVATVIPYYERFISRFPDVRALADAGLDEVLACWSGLGYYSRARNLHRAAEVIRDAHGGTFPAVFDDVIALPGIGRSTAAAVMVFAYGARHAILDGNVKRVLARVCGIPGYPGDKTTAEALWRAAERLLPQRDLEAYTQGLMDLGATVCLRRQPKCNACPAAGGCIAFREHRTHEMPAPRPRKPLPHRSTVMVVLERGGELLLEKRPAPGIWGGLWCFPELQPEDDLEVVCAQRYGVRIAAVERLPAVEHGFTHFSLTISPHRVTVVDVVLRAAEDSHRWLTREHVRREGIPAPVKRILDLL